MEIAVDVVGIFADSSAIGTASKFSGAVNI
jgi:hypothetical protein